MDVLVHIHPVAHSVARQAHADAKDVVQVVQLTDALMSAVSIALLADHREAIIPT